MNDDELIALAKKAKPVAIDEKQQDEYTRVDEFISELKIKSGLVKVMTSVLYDCYKAFSFNPKARKAFTEEFARYFEIKGNTGAKRYFMLNITPMTLMKKSKDLGYNEEKETNEEVQD